MHLEALRKGQVYLPLGVNDHGLEKSKASFEGLVEIGEVEGLAL